MSVAGYFKSCIEIYKSFDKITEQRKRDMRIVLKQFEIARDNGELGDDEDLKKWLTYNMNDIRMKL